MFLSHYNHGPAFDQSQLICPKQLRIQLFIFYLPEEEEQFYLKIIKSVIN